MPHPPRTYECTGCHTQLTLRPSLYGRADRALAERDARHVYGWSKTRAHGWRCPECQDQAQIREEWVTCGKPGCKCARGGTERHGPYRYTYATGADGKRTKVYHGKHDPRPASE
jgi:hypothetical protein